MDGVTKITHHRKKLKFEEYQTLLIMKNNNINNNKKLCPTDKCCCKLQRDAPYIPFPVVGFQPPEITDQESGQKKQIHAPPPMFFFAVHMCLSRGWSVRETHCKQTHKKTHFPIRGPAVSTPT